MTPQVEYLAEINRFKLIAPLVTAEITVPKGTPTDGASVPRVFWPLFPKVGPYFAAAVVHDYMYVHAIGSKREADELFLVNMKRASVPGWQRWPMYWAVRLFGRGSY